MKSLLGVLVAVLLSGWVWVAQQSPPADGVGLGNDHLNSNGSTSNVPSMSPDQNSVMTDTSGSVSGDKGTPAFGGAPAANSATRVNAQGTMGASESASARRRLYKGNQDVESTQTSQSRQTASKTSSASGQKAKGQSKQNAAAAQK